MAKDVHFQDPVEYCKFAAVEAFKICHETIGYCLRKGGEHARASLIQLLCDAAEINQVMAAALARGSVNYKRIGQVCMEISALCANACESLSNEDKQLKVCYAASLASTIACGRLLGAIQEDESEQAFYDRIIEETFPASDPPPGVAMV